MITGIAHVCYQVRNLEVAAEFYCQKLGMRHAFDFTREGKRFGVYLRAGQRTFIELFTHQHDAPAEGQSYRHLCLEVQDMPATVAQLRAAGVDVTDPKMGIDQSWQAWLSDPEGNKIELHEYTAQSWQAPHLG